VFEEARTALGKGMEAENLNDIDNTLQGKGFDPDRNVNPIQCMLAIRFFRDDIGKKSPAYAKAKDILLKVIGTGNNGALIGIRMYKKEIDRYIQEMIDRSDKYHKEHENNNTKEREYRESCSHNGVTPDSNIQRSNTRQCV
jgi:hypothetical protein